jgi:hypothetical protein
MSNVNRVPLECGNCHGLSSGICPVYAHQNKRTRSLVCISKACEPPQSQETIQSIDRSLSAKSQIIQKHKSIHPVIRWNNFVVGRRHSPASSSHYPDGLCHRLLVFVTILLLLVVPVSAESVVEAIDDVVGVQQGRDIGVRVFDRVFDRAFDRAVRGRWTFVDQDIKLVVEFSLAYYLEPFFDSTRLGDGVVNDLALQAPNGMHFRAKSGVERGWVDGGAAEGLQVFDGIDLPGDSGA